MLSNTHWFRCYIVLLLIFCISCSQSKQKKRPSFKEVEGIKFIEVRREFNTGLSFSKEGFQQEPEWTLSFLQGDSIKIYSPYQKRYIFYPIYFDHDQVVNLARQWLRIIHVSKDSLVFQLLNVQSKKVNQKLSTVYMRFYSENYIKNVLHVDPESMRKPSRRDTAYIRQLVKRANENPLSGDSLFAARNPVVFKSKVKEVTAIKRQLSKDDLTYSASDAYLNPEYDIHIKKAYKNFAHNFTAFIDSRGNMTVGKFSVIEKDFEAPQRKVLQGILDVYIERFFEVTPGKTLGTPHATEVMLHVRGTKD